MRRATQAAAALLPAAVLALATSAFASAAGAEPMTLNAILWEMGIKVLDVAIIAFFGFKFLAKPISRAMADRSEAVRRALEEASAGRREAEARLAGFQQKAAGLEAEIDALRAQAAADMERERGILLAEGRAAAERVAQHARETIRQEVLKARSELHRDAADLAVRLAREHVAGAVNAEDQRRLTADYLTQMETAR